MLDNVSTGVSTDAGQSQVAATQQQQSGSTSSSTANSQSLVNPAQTTQQNFQDVSGIIASYESRVRSLMSDKDKAINERNTAIAQLAELQKTYTEEKARDQNSLTTTANAAQTAITQSQTYAQQMATMQGELLRANILLQKPHLVEYAQFIPTNQDAEQMKLLVEQLEAVRLRDLERNGHQGYTHTNMNGSNPLAQQQQQNGLPLVPTMSNAGSAYVVPPASSLPNQSGATNPLNLTMGQQQQQNQLAQMGSNPAVMNPTGGVTSAQQIQKMLSDALASGNTQTYNDALAKAITMVPSAVQQELGRA